MYKAYLFNIEGRYQAPVYLNNEEAIFKFVFRYKDLVPKIMITQDDLSVFEVEKGTILFPELDNSSVEELSNKFDPLSDATTIESLMTLYNENVRVFEESLGQDKDAYQLMIDIESDMFALAAKDNVNLATFGWVNTAVIETALDSFD